MSLETAQAVIALVRTRAEELELLHVDWFGGEPLLARKIVYLIGEAISEVCDRNGVILHGSITTNGSLLTMQSAQDLIKRNICNFQISIDGPPEIHDMRRHTAEGGATYQIIWENISRLLQSSLQFKMQLRIHFDLSTYYVVREWVAAEIGILAKDPRVDVVFAHVQNLSDDSSAHVAQMGTQERILAIAELKKHVVRGYAKEDSDYICYAAQPNSFVIRADGRVGKCTVALQDQRNTIGRISANGELLLDGNRMIPWMAGWDTEDSAQLACPYSKMGEVTIEPSLFNIDRRK